MKTSKFLLLSWVLLCGLTLHAQNLKVVEQIERIVTRRAMQSVSVISQQTNAALYNRLHEAFRPREIPFVAPRPYFPQPARPVSFQVHGGPYPIETASAFAIEKEGRLLGVTAAHVMDNIEEMPYVTFQVEPTVYQSAPIAVWRKGHHYNTDIAVFEIPKEAQPYVHPLPVLEQPLHSRQQVSITGFAYNLPLWFPQEEVLFAGLQQVLVKSNVDQPEVGLCGAPVMVDGKVAGVYVGFATEGNRTPEWMRLLESVSSQSIPPIHRVVPISQITPFVQSLLEKTSQPRGTLLKVLGHPITFLEQEDFLFSVDLIRRGELVQSVYAGPLADPEHLENFLHIKENDIIRLSISRKDGSFQTYDFNVSTGKATRSN